MSLITESPINIFLDERCIYDEDYRTSLASLEDAVREWCEMDVTLTFIGRYGRNQLQAEIKAVCEARGLTMLRVRDSGKSMRGVAGVRPRWYRNEE